MRSINVRYLLTYLLTYLPPEHTQFPRNVGLTHRRIATFLLLRVINTLTYLPISFLLIAVYGSSVESPPSEVVGMFLLHGLECYKGTQMKAYDKYDKYVEYCVTLKCGLRGRSRSLEMAPLDRLHTSSHYSSIVTIRPYLVSFPKLSEILVEKANFFIHPFHLTYTVT